VAGERPQDPGGTKSRRGARPTTGEVVAIVVIALLGLMLIVLLFGERVDQILEIYSHSI
jgi:hypothetical protein